MHRPNNIKSESSHRRRCCRRQQRQPNTIPPRCTWNTLFTIGACLHIRWTQRNSDNFSSARNSQHSTDVSSETRNYLLGSDEKKFVHRRTAYTYLAMPTAEYNAFIHRHAVDGCYLCSTLERSKIARDTCRSEWDERNRGKKEKYPSSNERIVQILRLQRSVTNTKVYFSDSHLIVFESQQYTRTGGKRTDQNVPGPACEQSNMVRLVRVRVCVCETRRMHFTQRANASIPSLHSLHLPLMHRVRSLRQPSATNASPQRGVCGERAREHNLAGGFTTTFCCDRISVSLWLRSVTWASSCSRKLVVIFFDLFMNLLCHIALVLGIEHRQNISCTIFMQFFIPPNRSYWDNDDNEKREDKLPSTTSIFNRISCVRASYLCVDLSIANVNNN